MAQRPIRSAFADSSWGIKKQYHGSLTEEDQNNEWPPPQKKKQTIYLIKQHINFTYPVANGTRACTLHQAATCHSRYQSGHYVPLNSKVLGHLAVPERTDNVKTRRHSQKTE